MTTLSNTEISKLTQEQQIRLIRLGFKHLDKKVTESKYSCFNHPKLSELWHDIMKTLEDVE